MLQDEYVKAYYAALLQRQHEQEEAANRQEDFLNTNNSDVVYGISERQVGLKSKHDEDEGDDDVEWEEAPSTGRNINQFSSFQNLISIWIFILLL